MQVAARSKVTVCRLGQLVAGVALLLLSSCGGDPAATPSALPEEPTTTHAEDWEVPEDYIGDPLEGADNDAPDEPLLDFLDPDRAPVQQYAEAFGITPEEAVGLLQWQADLNEFVGELRALPSYAHSEIVHPSDDDPGGLDVYLFEPSASDLAFVDTLPAPPLGSVDVRLSAISGAEAEHKIAAEEGRIRDAEGTGVPIDVTIDWETGDVLVEALPYSGMIVRAETGAIVLVRVFLDVPGDDASPVFDDAIELRNVDPEQFDFFAYPGGAPNFSDYYAATGTLESGILEVETLEFLSENEDRIRILDCEAALEADNPDACPPGWLRWLIPGYEE